MSRSPKGVTWYVPAYRGGQIILVSYLGMKTDGMKLKSRATLIMTMKNSANPNNDGVNNNDMR